MTNFGPHMGRVAVISDIHGNGVALDAVLADWGRRGGGGVVCLGDATGGGPHPDRVLARLRELDCRMVRGNADDWLLSGLPRANGDADTEALDEIVAWAREQLSDQDRTFLGALPPTLELTLDETTRLLAFHGTPRGTTERLLHTMPDSLLAERLGGRPAGVLAGGHTHLQGARGHRGALLLNPGSVGVPVRDERVESWLPDEVGWVPTHAEYALVEYEGAAVAVTLVKVPVDPDAVRRAAERSGMPHARNWAALLARRVSRFNQRGAPSATSATAPSASPRP
jgi:predicted phosphodiesterase